MQVLNFHPGFIYTSSARELGYTDRSLLVMVSMAPGFMALDWNYFTWTLTFCSDDLPAHYAVWAASDEAAFLHGRYTGTEWYVEELSSGEVRKRIDDDSKYLRIGVLCL
ncbi:hypothetical protein F4801DRAFT_150473 [Xylaria longipes]|nr:hypothetical protein F4801DRAFT_150473 [Xylaria longipes]